MRDQDLDPRDSGAQNLYRSLLHKLTGTTIHKPQQKSAINSWQKTQQKEIDLTAKEIIDKENTPWSKHAAVQDKVAHDLFEDLPEDEKAQWMEQANEDYEVAVARWKQDTEGNPSIAPEDHQR
jgi:hypothetical protein